jgi:hypothetical protein
MSATMSSEGPCGVLPPLPSALHKPLATLQQSMRLMLRGHEEHRLQDILQMVGRPPWLPINTSSAHVLCLQAWPA